MLLRNLVDLSQDRSQHLGSIVTKMSETIVLVLMLVLLGLVALRARHRSRWPHESAHPQNVLHPFEG